MNLISCEKLEKSMVELQFSIDAETFKAAVNNAFKREGKKYAIPGFRKGKAPRHMIEKMYGSDIFHYDAVNDLFPEAYEAAVKEAKIDVVGRPDPEVVSMSEADGVVLKVKVAVKPEVELGEYAGLTVTKEAKNVNEADVDAEVKRMQDRNGRLLTRGALLRTVIPLISTLRALLMARLLRAARRSMSLWFWAPAPSSPVSRIRLLAIPLAKSSTSTSSSPRNTALPSWLARMQPSRSSCMKSSTRSCPLWMTTLQRTSASTTPWTS